MKIERPRAARLTPAGNTPAGITPAGIMSAGLLLAGLLLAAPSNAAVVDVSKAGPYTTIAAGISAASPGDLVRINDSSSYTEQLVISTPLTLRAGPGVRPRLCPTGTGDAIQVMAQSVTIQGIDIVHTGSGFTASVHAYAPGVRVADCLLDSGGWPNVSGVHVEAAAAGAVVSNCRVAGSYQNGIFVDSSSNVTVRGCAVSNCTAGVIVLNTHGVRILSGRFVDFFGDGVYCSGCGGDVLILYNFASSGGPRNIVVTNDVSAGRVVVCNNTAINNSVGLALYGPAAGFPRVVQNNILWGNGTDLYVDPSVAGTSVQFLDNCAAAIPNLTSPPLAFNGWLQTAPQFDSSGGQSGALQAGSPCIDAGAAFDFGFFGLAFPVYGMARDIGCYESLGQEAIPPFPGGELTSGREIVLDQTRLDPSTPCNILVRSLAKNQGDSDKRVFLEVAVVSLRGEVVRTLFNGLVGLPQFWVAWDGKDDGGAYVTPGIYSIRVRSGGFTAARKVSFVR